MNISSLKISELRALQEKITQEIKKRQDEEIVEARKQIHAIAQSVGMPLKDLLNAPVHAKSGKVAVRFRHPDNAELKWTGRGHQPVWVREWLASGKSIDALRIK